MVKIVTDSTSDLSLDLAQELGITIVPLNVHFGPDEVYRDRVDLSMEEFYRKLVSGKAVPTTSAPSPGAFAEAFDKLSEETSEILALIISSKYSATYSAALKGREEVKRRDCNVEIIDTLNSIMGLGLMVIAAAKEAKEGVNLEELSSVVKELIPKAHARFSVDTLEYLRKGGRIGTAKAFLGTILSFKPILEIIDGYTAGVGRVRSKAKAMEHLVGWAKGFPKITEMAVGYSTIPENAALLKEKLSSVFPKERIYTSIIGSITGTHIGPGALEVAVIEE